MFCSFVYLSEKGMNFLYSERLANCRVKCQRLLCMWGCIWGWSIYGRQVSIQAVKEIYIEAMYTVLKVRLCNRTGDC